MKLLEMKRFRVTYNPFSTSDLTSELEMTGTDIADVRKRFEANTPGWSIVSIEELG